ncbi:MAG: class I SAM-dependent methyltransferase [Planctomycetes bacterium]|nr:class I SAM-dependent methyltransferase [Planctomycetota bacterium]
MRATHRSHGGNRDYWRLRWEAIEADGTTLNLARYPGRHAEATLARASGAVLEAGCGPGRVLRYYHGQGRRIVGLDFIEAPLHKLHGVDDTLPLLAGDILQLPFASGVFGCVLAFGLYHNLENGLNDALSETRRVLRHSGVLCASFRADNLQNRILDALSDSDGSSAGTHFHKMNYTEPEIRRCLSAAGFAVTDLEYVQNMPFLHKLALLRHRHDRFDEHSARAKGYQLSTLGEALQRTSMTLWPRHFCNVYVATATAV